ncbi:aminotransferase class I/II-fold pyridoxal phosphate-dependent enzyme (plasmid) [Mycobacterium sp. SMC-8]|nr:aminotransferase class I/II-fold pyridoxal phosphate-dependent enzyme [Mycobacterium sp. SMC-8]
MAIHGGRRTSAAPWPGWPIFYPETEQYLAEVAASGVWTISGRSSGARLQVALFREEFAAFTTRTWCVEVDHGTSALVVAFEALGIGPGDEVIVPVLTWIACASAVLRVGATPVFVDVDAETLCMDVSCVESAVTERTACVLVVHTNCSAVDINAVMRIRDRHGLRVIEDCAQAHGAEWLDGTMIGTHGDLAVYSFQNSKSLTGGEGGAVVGDDDVLRRRVESARADTRESIPTEVPAGEMYLSETGPLMGSNYCMSEFNAAVIRAGLLHLRDQLLRKHENAEYLDELLRDRGFRTIRNNPALGLRSVYEYGVFLDGAIDVPLARTALIAELGFPVYEMDAPIHRSPIYVPATKPGFASRKHLTSLSDRFPVAEAAHERLAMIHHGTLLVDKPRMNEIADAFQKVRDALTQSLGSEGVDGRE